MLQAAAKRMPCGASLEVATIHGIPLYDGDLEAAEGLPAAVVALKDRIAWGGRSAPRHAGRSNNPYPAPFKNARSTGSSRPTGDIAGRVFGDRPVAVIGASLGGFGTILAQGCLAAGAADARDLSVVRRPAHGLPRPGVFDAAGALTDAGIAAQLDRNSWKASSPTAGPADGAASAAAVAPAMRRGVPALQTVGWPDGSTAPDSARTMRRDAGERPE
ncbi:NADPH-dependent FMN reductase [Dankookia sp. P2]|uniref:NADPH-dependent FMN reductase n=1 Tax=Dankookia sp. P2 TaxID=3423955 RepID=UPI003D666575